MISVCSMWYGPQRPKYLGPIDAAYPPYLEGEAPADYGFDILKLGSTPQSFERYVDNFALQGHVDCDAMMQHIPRCRAALSGF